MACEEKVTLSRETENLLCKSVHILERDRRLMTAVPYTEIMESIVSDLSQL